MFIHHNFAYILNPKKFRNRLNLQFYKKLTAKFNKHAFQLVLDVTRFYIRFHKLMQNLNSQIHFSKRLQSWERRINVELKKMDCSLIPETAWQLFW